MSRIFVIIGIVVLIVLAVLVVTLTVPFGTGADRSGPRPDLPPYASAARTRSGCAFW